MENFIISEQDLTIKNNKPTGRIMFQFDEDKPNELGIINNYSPLTLTLQQNKKSEDNKLFVNNTTGIEFTSKCGKKFKIFIEDL